MPHGVQQEMLVRRSDDAPEKLQRRLQRYGENIVALRNYYRSTCYTVLDGTHSENEVVAQAHHAIKVAEGMSHHGNSLCVTSLHFQKQEEIASAIRDVLDQVQVRLGSAETLLRTFADEVRCKWHTDVTTQTCGCKTETTAYIGAEPPKLEACGASASEVNKLLEDVKGKLWLARNSHWQHEYGNSSMFPWFSCLFITCCKASDRIELLQSRYNNLCRWAFDIQNMLTTETTKTAKRIVIIHCATHLPPPVPPGSP